MQQETTAAQICENNLRISASKTRHMHNMKVQKPCSGQAPMFGGHFQSHFHGKKMKSIGSLFKENLRWCRWLQVWSRETQQKFKK